MEYPVVKLKKIDPNITSINIAEFKEFHKYLNKASTSGKTSYKMSTPKTPSMHKKQWVDNEDNLSDLSVSDISISDAEGDDWKPETANTTEAKKSRRPSADEKNKNNASRKDAKSKMTTPTSAKSSSSSRLKRGPSDKAETTPAAKKLKTTATKVVKVVAQPRLPPELKYQLSLWPVLISDLENQVFRSLINLASDIAIDFSKCPPKSTVKCGVVHLHMPNLFSAKTVIERLVYNTQLMHEGQFSVRINCYELEGLPSLQEDSDVYWRTSILGRLMLEYISPQSKKIRQVKNQGKSNAPCKTICVNKVPSKMTREMMSLLYPFSNGAELVKRKSSHTEYDTWMVEYSNSKMMISALNCFRDQRCQIPPHGPEVMMNMLDFSPSKLTSQDIGSDLPPNSCAPWMKKGLPLTPKSGPAQSQRGLLQSPHTKRPLPYGGGDMGPPPAKMQKFFTGPQNFRGNSQGPQFEHLRQLAVSRGLNPNHPGVMRLLQIQSQLSRYTGVPVLPDNVGPNRGGPEAMGAKRLGQGDRQRQMRKMERDRRDEVMERESARFQMEMNKQAVDIRERQVREGEAMERQLRDKEQRERQLQEAREREMKKQEQMEREFREKEQRERVLREMKARAEEASEREMRIRVRERELEERERREGHHEREVRLSQGQQRPGFNISGRMDQQGLLNREDSILEIEQQQLAQEQEQEQTQQKLEQVTYGGLRIQQHLLQEEKTKILLERKERELEKNEMMDMGLPLPGPDNLRDTAIRNRMALVDQRLIEVRTLMAEKQRQSKQNQNRRHKFVPFGQSPPTPGLLGSSPGFPSMPQKQTTSPVGGRRDGLMAKQDFLAANLKSMNAGRQMDDPFNKQTGSGSRNDFEVRRDKGFNMQRNVVNTISPRPSVGRNLQSERQAARNAQNTAGSNRTSFRDSRFSQPNQPSTPTAVGLAKDRRATRWDTPKDQRSPREPPRQDRRPASGTRPGIRDSPRNSNKESRLGKEDNPIVISDDLPKEFGTPRGGFNISKAAPSRGGMHTAGRPRGTDRDEFERPAAHRDAYRGREREPQGDQWNMRADRESLSQRGQGLERKQTGRFATSTQIGRGMERGRGMARGRGMGRESGMERGRSGPLHREPMEDMGRRQGLLEDNRGYGQEVAPRRGKEKSLARWDSFESRERRGQEQQWERKVQDQGYGQRRNDDWEQRGTETAWWDQQQEHDRQDWSTDAGPTTSYSEESVYERRDERWPEDPYKDSPVQSATGARFGSAARESRLVQEAPRHYGERQVYKETYDYDDYGLGDSYGQQSTYPSTQDEAYFEPTSHQEQGYTAMGGMGAATRRGRFGGKPGGRGTNVARPAGRFAHMARPGAKGANGPATGYHGQQRSQVPAPNRGRRNDPLPGRGHTVPEEAGYMGLGHFQGVGVNFF